MRGDRGARWGLPRDLGNHRSAGPKFRNENLLPDYGSWENSALFLGPVVSHRQEKGWAALTVMPQVYGWTNSTSPEGDPHLELNDQEKLNPKQADLLNRYTELVWEGTCDVLIGNSEDELRKDQSALEMVAYRDTLG